MNAIATMTERGQVTLPKKVRQFLASRILEFEVKDDVVVVRPVRSVGGSLAAYADKHRPLSETRDLTWKDVADEKAKAHSS